MLWFGATGVSFVDLYFIMQTLVITAGCMGRANYDCAAMLLKCMYCNQKRDSMKDF